MEEEKEGRERERERERESTQGREKVCVCACEREREGKVVGCTKSETPYGVFFSPFFQDRRDIDRFVLF